MINFDYQNDMYDRYSANRDMAMEDAMSAVFSEIGEDPCETFKFAKFAIFLDTEVKNSFVDELTLHGQYPYQNEVELIAQGKTASQIYETTEADVEDSMRNATYEGTRIGSRIGIKKLYDLYTSTNSINLPKSLVNQFHHMLDEVNAAIDIYGAE